MFRIYQTTNSNIPESNTPCSCWDLRSYALSKFHNQIAQSSVFIKTNIVVQNLLCFTTELLISYGMELQIISLIKENKWSWAILRQHPSSLLDGQNKSLKVTFRISSLRDRNVVREVPALHAEDHDVLYNRAAPGLETKFNSSYRLWSYYIVQCLLLI